MRKRYEKICNYIASFLRNKDWGVFSHMLRQEVFFRGCVRLVPQILGVMYIILYSKKNPNSEFDTISFNVKLQDLIWEARSLQIEDYTLRRNILYEVSESLNFINSNAFEAYVMGEYLKYYTIKDGESFKMNEEILKECYNLLDLLYDTIADGSINKIHNFIYNCLGNE